MAGRRHAGQRARRAPAPARQNSSAALRLVAHHVGVEGDRREPARLEADVGALRRAEAAQQQPGHHQQHRGERHLRHDQRVAQRPAAAADARRRRLAAQVADQAGRRRLERRQQAGEQAGDRGDRPARTPARARRAAGRARRRPAAAARCPAARCTSAHAQRQRRRPRRARRAAAPSTSSCWISRPRLAPIASRTLISRRRAEARASSMPATFAQAISSTRPTIAISPAAPIDSTPPACGTSSRTSSVGTADILRSLLVCGLAAASCAPISATLACACAARDAGLEPALDEHPAHAAALEPRACRSATAPSR